MNSYLKTLMRGITTVIDYCTSAANQPTTDSVPAFADSVTALQSMKDTIDGIIEEQTKKLNGYYAEKIALKIASANSAMDVIAPSMAYCAATGNTSLLDEIRNSFTDLMKTSDADYVPAITRVSGLITPILSSVTPYGVTSAKMSAMNTAAAAYGSFLSAPRQQIAMRAAATAMLTKQVRTANGLMRTTMDPLSQNFKNNAATEAFYLGYRGARKHAPTGSRHTRLDVVVTDELGQPFYNVTVTVDSFEKDGRTFQAASAMSDIDGQCEVSEFEAGIRSVTLSGDGIITKTVDGVSFVRGKVTKMTFVCAPSFSNIPASGIAAAAVAETSGANN